MAEDEAPFATFVANAFLPLDTAAIVVSVTNPCSLAVFNVEDLYLSHFVRRYKMGYP